MKALKIIQDNNPDVEISFTLATMPTGLLAQSGLMIVKTAIQEGVKFKMINLMLMDYGGSFPANVEGELKMAAYSIQALRSVNAQLTKLLSGKSGYNSVNGKYYNLLGATPMIGRNDILVEYFYRDDVTKLTQFCNQVGVKMTSMWSLNRDKAIVVEGKGETSELYKSTKLTKAQYGNGKYEFSKLLKEGRQ
jgi:chitinase